MTKAIARRESDVLASVLALLKARGIFALRLNTGAVRASYRGKKRFVRFGIPGVADVLAFPKDNVAFLMAPLWVEAKSSAGKQSPDQAAFQRIVEAEGHSYLVVRSAAELNDWLRERGI